jgi:D-psicose/D-tagatose/L-ribulose 3-epimerase
MRFGCCSILAFPNSEVAAIEAADELKRIGYDYIELSLRHLTALKRKEFKNVVRILTRSGLKAEACHNFFPDHLKVTGSDVNFHLIADYARSSLERAAEVGAEVVVFGSGVSRNVPMGFSQEKATEQLISLLSCISVIAREFGIYIVIEPLKKEECNIINTTFQGIQLLESVSKDNVRLLIDFYHLSKEDGLKFNFPNAERYIQHIHFARPRGRRFPRRIEEDSRYFPFFSELRKMNYNKRISIEAYTRNFQKDAKESLDFLHAVCSL